MEYTESGGAVSGPPHQPQNRNHPKMSAGRNDRHAAPIDSYNSFVVRAAADFRNIFAFDHNASIGVRSELDGGNGTNSAPAGSISGFTCASRCGLRLSPITTLPDCNCGASTSATEVWKAGVSVAPSKASGATTPDSRRAAISVTVVHWPGTVPTTRSPRGARP